MTAPTHADTLDRALRLLARARRVLDYQADEIQNGRALNRAHAGIAQDLAGEIVALIGHSVTDQPEAPEMFALREHLGELAEREGGLREALAGPARDWQERHRQGSFVTTPEEFVNAILALPEMAALLADAERVRRVEALCRAWETKAQPVDSGTKVYALRRALTGPDRRPVPLPLHRTEAGYPRCATCDGGGCPDCTDPA